MIKWIKKKLQAVKNYLGSLLTRFKNYVVMLRELYVQTLQEATQSKSAPTSEEEEADLIEKEIQTLFGQLGAESSTNIVQSPA